MQPARIGSRIVAHRISVARSNDSRETPQNNVTMHFRRYGQNVTFAELTRHQEPNFFFNVLSTSRAKSVVLIIVLRVIARLILGDHIETIRKSR